MKWIVTKEWMKKQNLHEIGFFLKIIIASNCGSNDKVIPKTEFQGTTIYVQGVPTFRKIWGHTQKHLFLRNSFFFFLSKVYCGVYKCLPPYPIANEIHANK